MASFCSADFIEGSPRFHSLQPFLLVQFIQLEGQTRAHTFPCVTLQRIIFLFQNNLHFEWLRAVSFTFPSLPQTKLEEKKTACVYTPADTRCIMEADLWGQVPMAEWHTSKGGKKKRVFRVKEETFFPGHNVGDFVVNFYF